jgi:hypothetical protein
MLSCTLQGIRQTSTVTFVTLGKGGILDWPL